MYRQVDFLMAGIRKFSVKFIMTRFCLLIEAAWIIDIPEAVPLRALATLDTAVSIAPVPI